jgi:hypothetical protein
MTGGETLTTSDDEPTRDVFDGKVGAQGSWGRTSLTFAALAVAIYAAARLWRLTSTCLWFDELYSLHAARHGWGAMLRFTAADLVHPPLFYALLKVWAGAGGESLLWLRLLPALTAIACVAPFLLLCRELRLRPAETNLALLLAAANGYLIKYAQELRMYSLLLLLTLCSLWLFARLLNDNGRRTPLALFVVNLLLVYTHYYGWLVLLSECGFLLARARQKLRPFLLSLAALVVCFAPWVYAVSNNPERGRGLEQNIGWVARPRLAELAEAFALFHEPFYFRQSSGSAAPPYTRWSAPAGFLLFGVPLALLIRRRLRRPRDASTRDDTSPARDSLPAARDGIWLLLVCAFLPVASAFALSWALPQSVWGTRHLIVAAAPYLLLASVAVSRLRADWLRVAVLSALGCWLFVGALVTFARRERPPVWCAWEQLAGDLTREAAPAERSVTVFAFEDLVAYHLWFALRPERDARFKVAVVKGVPGLTEDPAYFLPRGFDGVALADASALEGPRLWLAFRDASWDETRPPLSLLKQRGYTIGRVYEFDAQGQKAYLAEALQP